MSYSNQLHIQLHSAAIYSICAGIHSNEVFTASGDKRVALWNITTGQQQPLAVTLEHAAYSVLYVSTSHLLFIGTSSGSLHVIDVKNKSELRHFNLHNHGIYDLAFDKKHSQLLAAGGDGILSVWSVPKLELVRSIPLCAYKLRQIALDPDKERIAVACGDGKLRVMDTALFNEYFTIDAHPNGANAVAWHHSKKVLVSGGKDAKLKIWKAESGYEKMLDIAAHHQTIYSIVLDYKGEKLFTASRDKTIKVWDANTMEVLQRLDTKSGGHSHSVNKLLWHNNQLISCGDDRKLIVWH